MRDRCFTSPDGVASARSAWIAITLGLVSWTFGEIWYVVVRPESYPSLADLGFLGDLLLFSASSASSL